MTNPMARAWLDAAADLGIRVVHPFRFTTKSGDVGFTRGVFLPDFGAPRGTLLTCRFDPEGLDDLAEDTPFRLSGLNPDFYEPYSRDLYIGTLSDWGWYGAPGQEPDWFDPNWRDKLELDIEADG